MTVHIVRYSSGGQVGVGVLDSDSFGRLDHPSMAQLLRLSVAQLRELIAGVDFGAVPADLRLLPPVDGRTEVWASGVTYARSREARVEESTQKSVYELVYDADRPELFFKAPAWRVVTTGDPVAIRSDSALNVPEPELAVVLNSAGEIMGALVCNDMSSRSIEGENPLYLPQAKMYAGACVLSTGIRPAWEIDTADLTTSLLITRDGRPVFSGSTTTARLRRQPTELAEWLYRSENFPDGAVLSTGTGIAPELDFVLREGDVIEIEIEQVGMIRNTVVRGKHHFTDKLDQNWGIDAASRMPSQAEPA